MCLKKNKKKKEGPLNGKLQSCMECENERFIMYVDGIKVVFKKKWLRKKKWLKRNKEKGTVFVVPSITVAVERSWMRDWEEIKKKKNERRHASIFFEKKMIYEVVVREDRGSFQSGEKLLFWNTHMRLFVDSPAIHPTIERCTIWGK